MTKAVISVLISFFVIGFFSCKKYPEDDVLIQWRRPDKRLIKYGPWVFDKLTVDGIDKSAEFRADSAYFDRMEFNDTKSPHETNLRIYQSNGYLQSNFRFIEEGKILEINVVVSLSPDYNYGPILTNSPVSWVILKLTKEELIIATLYSGQYYELKLIPE